MPMVMIKNFPEVWVHLPKGLAPNFLLHFDWFQARQKQMKTRRCRSNAVQGTACSLIHNMLADMERTKTLLVGGWLADWLVPLGLLQEVLSQRPLESSLDYMHVVCR